MSASTLAEALAECLAEVEAGLPLELAVARHPDWAAELEPLVRMALALNRRRPYPRPAWRAEAQRQVLAGVARPRLPGLRWPLRLAAPAMAAVAVLVLALGVAAASWAAGGPEAAGQWAEQIAAAVRALGGGSATGRPGAASPGSAAMPGATPESAGSPGSGGGRSGAAPAGGARTATIMARQSGPRRLVAAATPLVAGGGRAAAPLPPRGPADVPPVPTATATAPPAAAVEDRPERLPPPTPGPTDPGLPLPVTPENGGWIPGPPTPGPAQAVELHGRVLRSDGQPLMGLTVTAYVEGGGQWWWTRRQVWSGADGRYWLPGLPSGRLKLLAYGGPWRFPFRWYPGVDDPGLAEVLTLAEGEIRRELDIRYPEPSPSPTPSETPTDPAGTPTSAAHRPPQTATPVATAVEPGTPAAPSATPMPPTPDPALSPTPCAPDPPLTPTPRPTRRPRR